MSEWRPIVIMRKRLLVAFFLSFFLSCFFLVSRFRPRRMMMSLVVGACMRRRRQVGPSRCHHRRGDWRHDGSFVFCCVVVGEYYSSAKQCARISAAAPFCGLLQPADRAWQAITPPVAHDHTNYFPAINLQQQGSAGQVPRHKTIRVRPIVPEPLLVDWWRW